MAKDRLFPENPIQNQSGVIGLASPKDRLAAYVLDATLLLPLVQLFQAPFKKGIFEALLFDEASQASFYRIMNLLVFIILFTLYYTFMTYWRGQTIGKMFFSIKVISYQGSLGLLQSFLRSFSIFLEFVCLGFPFQALFTHPLRRPIHDRVADTLVISTKNPISFPTPGESFKARLASAVFSSLIALFVFAYVVDGPGEIYDLDLISLDTTCQDIENLGEKGIEQALELHLSQKIDDDCLRDRARENLWLADTSVLAPFAMGMATRKYKEKSQKYFLEVCQVDSESSYCELSQWLLVWGSDEEETSLELFHRIADREVPSYVQVMTASLLMGDKRYDQALQVLQRCAGEQSLCGVSANIKFHSLLGKFKWDEAYWVFETNNQVNEVSLLSFLDQVSGDSKYSVAQKIQLLHLFYPELDGGESKLGRMPASVSSVPEAVQDYYYELESLQ